MTYEKIMFIVKYLLFYIFNKFLFNVILIPFLNSLKESQIS
jgi:hypothetical protein